MEITRRCSERRMREDQLCTWCGAREVNWSVACASHLRFVLGGKKVQREFHDYKSKAATWTEREEGSERMMATSAQSFFSTAD
ncbi:hypothetical protein INR49_023620 [Caranx melampygus]|nr:hypothetical protein INR49_023620 [Caranx melampygus]